MVVACDRLRLARCLGAALGRPEFIGFCNDNDKAIGVGLIIDPADFPAFAQTQQLMKNIFDNHEPLSLPEVASPIPLEMSKKQYSSCRQSFRTNFHTRSMGFRSGL